MTTKDEITLSLLQDEGKFKLVERRGKSAVWKLFGQVFDLQSQSCLPLYGCYGCKVLYAENAGTGSLARHKCPLLKILANHADELLAEVKHEEPDKPCFEQLPSTSLQKGDQMTLDILNSFLGSDQNHFTEGVKEEPMDETELGKADVTLDPQNMLNLADILGHVSHPVEVDPKLIEGPKDRSSKEVLFHMIEQKDPDIVLKEHKKLPTISTIERYHQDEDGNRFLKKTLYVICRCCNQMLTSAVGGHLNRHVKRCRGERSQEKKPSQLFSAPVPEPPVPESTRETESVVSVVATYCVESFVNFFVVEDHSFEKMIRTVSKNQEEDFPTGVEIENEAKMMHDELRGKFYSKVIVAISQKRVSLVVDFGQHIAQTLSVFAKIQTDGSHYETVPLGFGTLKDHPSPEKIFEQLGEICRGMKLNSVDIKKCQLFSEPYPGAEICGNQYMAGHHKIDPDYRPLVKKNRQLFEVFDMIQLCDKYRLLIQRWQTQTVYTDMWVLLTAALLL